MKDTEHTGLDAVGEQPGGRAAAYVWAATVSTLLIATLYVLTADIDLDLRDEGFLWYGVRQTAAGQVPGGDFQAYDPGRYYWGAAWSMLFGGGILALRLSTAIFQGLGLFLGLLVARRTVARAWLLIPIAAVLTVWMFPRHKLFEPSLAMAAVFFAVRLLERPSVRRHMVSGLFVGVAAVFGRNHGVYTALAFVALILFEHLKRREGTLARKLGAWAIGVVLGFSPMLLMLAFVPGFAGHFLDTLLAMADRGTNLPRPVPWPWTIEYASRSAAMYIPEFVLSLGYLGLACIYPIGLLWSLFTRRESMLQRAVLIACLFVGAPYAHHAFVRASASHLAQSIHPLLLALFALPFAFGVRSRALVTATVWTVLGLGAAVVGWGVHPQLATFGRRAGEEFQVTPVAGDDLRLPVGQARAVVALEALVADHVPPAEAMFIAPYRTAYYPLLGKVAPLWDIYMLWSATPEYQQGMIESLDVQGVNWALLVEESMNSAPGTTFSDTHRKVIRYLGENFEPIEDRRMPVGHYLLRRRK